MDTAIRTDHPHVTRRAGVCGGSPVVGGRRIPVWQIARWIERGRPAEEIVAEYAGRLSRAAVYDAISYSYDHQDEVAAELRGQTSEPALRADLERLDAERGPRGGVRFRSRPAEEARARRVAIGPPGARVFLDEDVHPSLAPALRRHGFDAVHAGEVGRRSHSDAEQLAFAAAEQRVLVTHNRRDFLALARQWWDRHAHHAGIVYARQAPGGEPLRRLLRLLDEMAAEDLRDLILPLESFG
jgi:uncharacterized protein (DUF433 family)